MYHALVGGAMPANTWAAQFRLWWVIVFKDVKMGWERADIGSIMERMSVNMIQM